MTNLTAEKEARLDELVSQYIKASELLEEWYVSYSKHESVEELRGVLKDVCQSCLVASDDDTDLSLGISNIADYECHEDMLGATCALCGEDFWGMKGGSLVLFEPKFSLVRWG